jgi:hypothetical protein
MIPKVRRKILRRYTTDLILFGTRHSEMYHEGRMGDVSLRGMQFGSPVAIDPGDQVWIRKAPAAGFPMNKDPHGRNRGHRLLVPEAFREWTSHFPSG